MCSWIAAEWPLQTLLFLGLAHSWSVQCISGQSRRLIQLLAGVRWLFEHILRPERVALFAGMRPMARGKCHHDGDVANFYVYGWLNAFK